ncbi:putative complex I intermediate-associated protein 30, mitochondrial, partial [Stegodyphus mimosarum]
MSFCNISRSRNNLRFSLYAIIAHHFKNEQCRRNLLVLQRRSFSCTQVRNSFFEKDNRGAGYEVYPDATLREHIRDGRKIFVEECKLWLKEVKEKFEQDPKLYYHGDTDVFFRFDSEECLKKWRVSSDKAYNEGYSECKLIVNDNGKGVFYGTIDTSPPKDGKNRYTGFCAIKSVRKKRSFLRDDTYLWSSFTHLELRVRGDGRNYAINLGLGMYFDVTWFDMFTYTFHTRGGPYWQVIRIPFSKFFLTSKGRIQDKQCCIPLNKVNSVGITAAAVSGPFRLEIDYIGCHIDHTH